MLAVIIPCYNHLDNLYQALNSLTIQTQDKFFTIVCDDASTDNVVELCNEFLTKLHIIYLRNEKNSGAGVARQLGLNWCYEHNIESVMFLDSDDILFPNAVQVLSYELNHGRYDFVKSDISVQHKHQPQTTIYAEKSITWLHGTIYRCSFLKQNNICFPTDFRTNEDLAFNLCVYWLSKNGSYLNNSVYLWRDNSESITRLNGKMRDNCAGYDYVRAIHYAFYFIQADQSFKINKLIPSLFACYSYYETYFEKTKEVNNDIQIKLFELFTHPKVVQYLSHKKNWDKLQQHIMPYNIYQKDKIIFFKETFYDWIKKYNGGLIECI